MYFPASEQARRTTWTRHFPSTRPSAAAPTTAEPPGRRDRLTTDQTLWSRSFAIMQGWCRFRKSLWLFICSYLPLTIYVIQELDNVQQCTTQSFAILHKTCITLTSSTFQFHICRFIVVCLLLKKMKLVRDLVRELSKQIGPSQVFHQTIFLQNERFPSLGLMSCNFFQMNTRPPTSPRTSWSGAWCWARSELLWRPTPSSTSSTTTATPSSSRTGFHPSSPRPWREVQSWIFLCKRCLDWSNFLEIG